MIKSSRAITLVLISAASVLTGYGMYHNSAFDDAGPDEYFGSTTQPTTRTGGYYRHSRYTYGHPYSSHYYYWGGSSSSSSGFSHSSGSSSSSSGLHGTSHGGFGGTAHGSAS